MSSLLTSYRSRLGVIGTPNIGNALKQQSDLIMNATFDRDIGYRKCWIYTDNRNEGYEIEAKVSKHSEYSILKDNVDLHLQFRPNVHPEKNRAYPKKDWLGQYIEIEDDSGEIYTYMIIGRNEEKQFVQYNILTCNWWVHWIKNGKIYHALGCLRKRNSYNSGFWQATWSETTENQAQIYLPTNDVTQQITYEDKFLITTNNFMPIRYEVSKREDTSPTGVTMLTLSLETADRNTDRLIKDREDHKFGGDYWIAEYDSCTIPPKDFETGENVIPLPTPKFDCSETEKGTSELLKCDIKGTINYIKTFSSYKNFTPQFYDSDGSLVSDIVPKWGNNIEGTEKEQYYKFNVTKDGKYQIKCMSNEQIGSVFTITLQDENGLYKPYVREIEVR